MDMAPRLWVPRAHARRAPRDPEKANQSSLSKLVTCISGLRSRAVARYSPPHVRPTPLLRKWNLKSAHIQHVGARFNPTTAVGEGGEIDRANTRIQPRGIFRTEAIVFSDQDCQPPPSAL